MQDFSGRVSTEVDVGDTTIGAEMRVHLAFGTAIGDEQHYSVPDECAGSAIHWSDLLLQQSDFGCGVHGCAGQAPARMEAKAVLVSLLHRVDGDALAGGPGFRGEPGLPMTLSSDRPE